jgi:sialate O-acetylesterase
MLRGFSIAGPDHRFVWAEATIEGDGQTVVVRSPQVMDPVAVRYGWSSNPDCNLVNSAGLPASPFRTDQFKGITQPD